MGLQAGCLLSLYPAGEHVVVGIKWGVVVAEFVEFFGGAVDLDADDLDEGDEFLEDRVDVGGVEEQGFGADVGFAAENGVVTDGEVVVEVILFRAGSADHLVEQCAGLGHVAGFDLEVGVDADDFGWIDHVGFFLVLEW